MLVLVALLVMTPTTIGDIAGDYVHLALALGEHDADYVDAYYGDPSWRDQAKREKKPVAQIESEAKALLSKLQVLNESSPDPLAPLRKRYLVAQLNALITRAQMLHGVKFPFDEEAKRLYGLTPPHHDDAFFDEAIKSLDKELPGSGGVADRMEAYRKRFNVPPAKLDSVVRAAMAECRARTLAHVNLPAGESFTLEYVHDKPWGGYNWYKGNYRSVIQVNTDLPLEISRALDLACHEGYPGHHTYNVLLEKNLVRDRGWVEYSVYPLFSPQSLVAEGTGNYGPEVAFPGDEAEVFNREKLFPLAGLDPAEAARYHRVEKLMERLAYTTNEAARRYLDGRITRPQAQAWLVRYGLYSSTRAAKQLDFIEKYRSYVINYNAGRDAVKAYVEAQPPARRWTVFADLISTPKLLSSQ
jgi:hypothetical protein